MGKTVNGIRIFNCKRCGKEERINIYKWRKRPQKDKNICSACIERRIHAARAARERAEYGPYFW